MHLYDKHSRTTMYVIYFVHNHETDIIQGLLHICTYDVDNTSQYNLQMSSATHDVQYTEEST